MSVRLLACALVAWASLWPQKAPAHELPPPARPVGLWVLAEGSQRVLEHPDRIHRLIEDAQALGASDLFVQVYRRGLAWWPSEHADPSPTWAAARKTASADPLASLIAAAHEAGLKVHAWVNLLSLADNADAALVAALGPGALQVDRKGRSVADYPDREVPAPDVEFIRMGTPALWVDPAAPGVAGWYHTLIAELFERYPGLDGLHLDYVRYPDVLPFTPGSRFDVGLDFGYGAATRTRFREETGDQAPFMETPGAATRWDAWRREKLTDLVRGLREEMTRAAPEARLSAAVIAWPSRAYLSLYQDWIGWLEAGAVDFAVPMLYTRDPRLFRQQAAAYTGARTRDRIWTGLGVWLFGGEPDRALEQLRELDGLDAAGRALFSWDAIAEAPALREALIQEAGRASRP